MKISVRHAEYMVRTLNEWMEADPDLTFADALRAYADGDEKIESDLDTLVDAYPPLSNDIQNGVVESISDK